MTLRLLNGTILLPEDAVLEVECGAALELVCVNITGEGARPRAFVHVTGKGSRAVLQQCTIVQMDTGDSDDTDSDNSYDGDSDDDDSDDYWPPVDGVRVSDGGTALLERCFISKATGRGLAVKGPSSSAYASQCIVEKCGQAGYAAWEGGRLTVERCVAVGNAGQGFISHTGSYLLAGPGCRAEWNKELGFYVTSNAELSAGRGCAANNNLRGGFLAWGLGARMRLEEGCTAEGNGDKYNPNDVVGFRALNRGSLVWQPIE
jgi:hypothetical protein